MEVEIDFVGMNEFSAAVIDRSGDVLGRRRRRWEDLSSDILVAIFSRIGVADRIAGVPYVCSAWRDAVRDPLCWRNLDFRNWSAISYRLGCRRDDAIDFADLLHFAISRSDEFLDSIHFPYFADEIDLDYVSARCPELLYFSIENPIISEGGFCKAISKLEYLKGMAIDEDLISHHVLQHVNQCCCELTMLKVYSDTVDRQMASIICQCLPSLQKLEITECLMSRDAILTLLDGLKELEYLDISGYEISGITSGVLEKASHVKVFLWDSKYDLGEFEYCSYCENDFLDETPCECVLDQRYMEWLATLS